MKSERRWMKWVLEESAKPQAALPWQRGSRRMPEALKASRSTAKPSLSSRAS